MLSVRQLHDLSSAQVLAGGRCDNVVATSFSLSQRRYGYFSNKTPNSTLEEHRQKVLVERLQNVMMERCDNVSRVRNNDVPLVRLYNVSNQSQMKYPTTSQWYVRKTSQKNVVATSQRYLTTTSLWCAYTTSQSNPTETLNDISNYVSELCCHGALLIRFYDVFKLPCHDTFRATGRFYLTLKSQFLLQL